ncbi:MAG: hypothetical protein H6819_04040 [Phycisphaerales bacterium]|nr:hypothetical protein [Phycisphaerales bacterium]MCB9856370.1 hypothetical protein [Phycisphaerales bacterium]MCB9864042.1 hypothetical protein [Phycisphaerales bacterium]
MLNRANQPDSPSTARCIYTGVVVGILLATCTAAWGQGRPDILWETMGHGAGVHAVAFSPGGSWVASGSEDSHVRTWAIADGQPGPDTQNCCGVYSLAISPDNARVASGSTIYLQISRTDNGEVLHRWNGGQSFPAIAYSPDGAWLASSAESGGVKIWDAQSRALLQTLSAQGPCRDIAFSPDGTKLAVLSESVVRVWNTSDWSPAPTLSGAGSTLESLQFSRDGSRILAANGQAQLWRVSDGALERTFQPSTGALRSAALSPDSRVVVGNSSFAGEIIFWDATNGAEIRTYDDGTDYLQKIRFSSSGRLYAYGQIDGNVVVAKNPFWTIGDFDGDGIVNSTDLSLFVDVLLGTNSNPEHRICADENADGMVNGLDVASFVAALTAE